MKLTILAALLLFSTATLAGGNENNNGNKSTTNSISTGGISNSGNSSSYSQGGSVRDSGNSLSYSQGGSVKNSGNSSAYTSSKGGAATQDQSQGQANSQSTTFASPDNITVRSAPNVFLGAPASGPCNGFSGGISGAGLGFGFAVNTSVVDEGCAERETARVAFAIGRTDIANLVLENMEVVKRAYAAEKVAKEKVATKVREEKVSEWDAQNHD